jgi:hypothetical protein
VTQSKQDDGGPAFPVLYGQTNGLDGMSLRDWFAGQAISGGAYMLGVSGADQELTDRRTLVATAYAIADDMLAQRAALGLVVSKASRIRYGVTAIMKGQRTRLVVSDGDDAYSTEDRSAAERVLAEVQRLPTAYCEARIETAIAPYAHEYGKSNGDGTFSVIIERGAPKQPHPDWPVKPLYEASAALYPTQQPPHAGD